MKARNLQCFFVSDLHGKTDRYEKLFHQIKSKKPGAVFLGGDLLPHSRRMEYNDFTLEFILPSITMLKEQMMENFPEIFMIPGNDDERCFEPSLQELENRGLWRYIHLKSVEYEGYNIAGCAYVPPTPFRLKDWERYDVSRYVDPGCIAPDEGKFTSQPVEDIQFVTIAKLLEELAGGLEMEKTVLLMHSPPYNSLLDRAALDNLFVDHIPLDVHVGSIALQRFIDEKKPMLTLHGHIHESSQLTGHWKQYFDTTLSINAAWHSQELSLVSFSLDNPSMVIREII